MHTFSPLSYGQRSLWFLHQLSPEGGAYNVTIPLKIRSPFDVDRLQHCFQILVARHPMLRSFYGFDGKQPGYQTISETAINIEKIDVSHLSEKDLLSNIHTYTHKIFSIDTAPVFRLAIFVLSGEEKVFVFSTHHLNADLFSLVNLLEEFFSLYELEDPNLHKLPPLERTFDDYVRWQTELLAGPEGVKLWAYWSEKFRAPLPKLELPLDKARPAVQTNNGSTFIFKLDRELSQKLKSMAKQEGSTPFMALLSIYYILLFQFSKQNDIIVGTPVPGRRGDPRFERVLGTFVNVLALRVNLEGALSFREVLGRVSATVRDARTHQEFPFPLLVEKLRPARDPSRAPIFQAYFTLQKLGNHQDWLSFFTPIKQDLEIEVSGLKLAPIEITQQEGQMELSVHIYDFNEDLYPEFKYNTDIFEISTIKKMAQTYTDILQMVVDDPSVLISRLISETVSSRVVGGLPGMRLFSVSVRS